MKALKIIEKAVELLGVGEDIRIHKCALGALNSIYAELFYLEGRSNFQEITDVGQDVIISEKAFFDLMPYGVASLMATALGDNDNAVYYGQIYNLKRKQNGTSVFEDVLPTP